MMNLPNLLTLFRIFIIPIFVLLALLDMQSTCFGVPVKNILLCALFALAGITDYFDGYLARKLNVSSPFGAFLDPVADKLIVAVALIIIAVDNPQSLIIVLCTIIIICREITISALREWMASLGRRNSVAVSWIGKWKTTFQMGAIGCLLFKSHFFGLPIFLIGEIGLIIAAALTLYSMVDYLILAYQSEKNHHKES
ncbi:CDP-diacylglycerol--glycerol-3-phosphate 3-phosphatidyltransferase [Wohlfahrtiimonas larvae]|uniref:CDP-diacylglycerol--glycerol-3-phosphate 3-phosphatidyltransferase n=1 Tax=Wohlfahrtiimonas larvae TaxID=1157986 RepID=A0ABP9MG78_9GAMM|nr:CDP-diacylglycerol--glycerol-3-phosphate 3-phosphatidyltransferase [Wohlfahrtiimonas larvae]